MLAYQGVSQMQTFWYLCHLSAVALSAIGQAFREYTYSTEQGDILCAANLREIYGLLVV